MNKLNIEKQLKKYGVTMEDMEKQAKDFEFKKVEDYIEMWLEMKQDRKQYGKDIDYINHIEDYDALEQY